MYFNKYKKICFCLQTLSLLLFFVFFDYFFRYQYFAADITLNSLFKEKTFLYSLSASCSFASLVFLLLIFRARKILVSIYFFIFGLLLIANDIHYSFFEQFISLKQISLISEGAEYILIIFERLKIWHFVFLALPVSFATVINRYFFSGIRPVLSFSFFSGLLFCSIISSASLDKSLAGKGKWAWDQFRSDVYLHDTIFNSEKFVHKFNMLEYLRRDTEILLAKHLPHSVPKEVTDIDRYLEMNPNEQPMYAKVYDGLYRGDNLILVLAESLGHNVIDKDLTPTLYKMQQEGIFFSNHYIPKYRRTTCDTEFLVQTGLLPSMIDGPTCYVYANNQYPFSLANLFKKHGYEVNSFHNHGRDYYNRTQLHHSLGFDEFYDEERMDLHGADNLFDSKIVDNAYSKIVSQGRFYSFILTLSGHGPYKENKISARPHLEKVEKKYGSVLNTEQKVYLASNMELDKMLSKLVEKLSGDNLLSNTVIAVFGDHYPYAMSKDSFIELVKTEDYYQFHKIPFVIWKKGGLKKRLNI